MRWGGGLGGSDGKRGYLLSRKKRKEVRQPFTNSIPSPKTRSNSTIRYNCHDSRVGKGDIDIARGEEGGGTLDLFVVFGGGASFVESLQGVHLFPQGSAFGRHDCFHVCYVDGGPCDHVEVLPQKSDTMQTEEMVKLHGDACEG